MFMIHIHSEVHYYGLYSLFTISNFNAENLANILK